MKTCLWAAYRDGEIGEFLGVTAVGDDHQFGPQPGGVIHVEGHGEYTVTAGKMHEDDPVRPPAVNGVPFSEVILHEDGHLSYAVPVRRRDSAEAAALIRAEYREHGIPDDVAEAMIAAVSAQPDGLVPYDLEADASLLWPQFAHERLAVGDVIELKRDGKPCRLVRVTRVIPGPGGQVMYDTEPAGEGAQQ